MVDVLVADVCFFVGQLITSNSHPATCNSEIRFTNSFDISNYRQAMNERARWAFKNRCSSENEAEARIRVVSPKVLGNNKTPADIIDQRCASRRCHESPITPHESPVCVNAPSIKRVLKRHTLESEFCGRCCKLMRSGNLGRDFYPVESIA